MDYILISDTESEYEKAELIFINDDKKDDDELTTYSYINNGYCYEYFTGYEIAALIGYKNPAEVIKNNVSKSNQLIFRDYPGVKIPALDPRTILITHDGVVEILLKTRKCISNDVLFLLKKFGIETTNKKCLTKEQQTLSHIANVFKTEKIEDQFKVDCYYLDMYFTDYKIVIECDENGHSDRKPGDERDRMDYVNFELDMDDTHWIRYNPDEYEFDIMKVIGRVHRKMDEIKAKKYEEEKRGKAIEREMEIKKYEEEKRETEIEREIELKKLKKEREKLIIKEKETEIEWKLQIEPITGKFTAPPKEVLEKLLETKNISDIAKLYTISSNPVSKWLQQYNIKIKDHHNYEAPSKEDLLQQSKNRSQTEVAQYYNVSNHIIRKWFTKYDLNFKSTKTLEEKINKKELLKADKESEGKEESCEKLNITEKNLEKLVKTHNIDRIPDKDELEKILNIKSKEDAATFLNTTRTTLRKWTKMYDLEKIRFTDNTHKAIQVSKIDDDIITEYSCIKDLCKDLKIGKNKVNEFVDTEQEYKGYKFKFIKLI